jgi:hypothetical protein
MRQIDRKYQTSGDITKVDGTPIPTDEPLILFRGKDKLLPQLLEDYRRLCEEAGSPSEHLTALDEQIKTIKSFQAANTDKVKVPD